MSGFFRGERAPEKISLERICFRLSIAPIASTTLANPTSAGFVFHGRYSDEQLYALTLFLYSLRPRAEDLPTRRVRGGVIRHRSTPTTN
jgi:hypothetical protein